MNTFTAREDADYSWEGDETGYRGHSHVVVCESDDGRVGYAYGNAERYDADDVLELCDEAEENLAPREPYVGFSRKNGDGGDDDQ